MSVGRGVLFKKTTVEECLRLDMTFLAKQVCLDLPGSEIISWKNGFGKTSTIEVISEIHHKIRLKYTVTKRSGQAKDYDYVVHLDTTPCNYGWRRWWFLCPNCYRRCRVLYLPPGESIFACRICHNLCYESQQENRNALYWLFRNYNNISTLEKLLFHTRSSKKRSAIDRKLRRSYGGLRPRKSRGKKK